MVKGVAYAGAVAAPAYKSYVEGGGGANGAVWAVQRMAFIEPTTGEFSFSAGVTQWTPVVALTAVDLVTSKLGLQRRISQGMKSILG